MERRLLLRLSAGLLGVAMVASACGQQPSSSGSSKELTVVNASGTQWTCNFNPFNPNANVNTDLVYEPLIVVNDLDGQETPWLATGYTWGAGNTELTLDIRKGVKWTDGKPLTAKDVVFNFELQKKFEALDSSALWSGGILESVTAQGDHKVLFKFKRVSTTSLRYILVTRIKPEHIWSKVSDPVTHEVKKTSEVVGTGPFTISTCTPQSITYTKNAKFWQKGKPKVEKVVYPAFKDNGPANRYLAQGKGDWGGQFVPNIEEYWVAKDPKHRKFWYPAVSNVSISVNVTDPMMKDKRVRQALAYAIDRAKVSKNGMYGYQKPASQTAVVDTFADWRDETAAAKYDYGYDCKKAQAKLKEAGFEKGKDGFFQTPDGKPFNPELINNGGFTDWVASVKVIGDSMKDCGINLRVSNLAGQQFNDRRGKGQYQLAYDSVSAGPTPYYEMRNWLYSKLTMPIGQIASANRGRWKDAKTDELIEAYDKTLDENEQREIVGDLQDIILEEVPFIPVTQNVSWSQTDTTNWTGWPTEDDPYANPAPYNRNWEVVLLRLEPVKEEK